jgi:hypothetical protein
MKFEKRENCQYCGNEMTSKYRNKKFCSPKCRVYFSREEKEDVTEEAISEDIDKSAPYDPYDRLKKLQKIKNK